MGTGVPSDPGAGGSDPWNLQKTLFWPQEFNLKGQTFFTLGIFKLTISKIKQVIVNISTETPKPVELMV